MQYISEELWLTILGNWLVAFGWGELFAKQQEMERSLEEQLISSEKYFIHQQNYQCRA